MSDDGNHVIFSRPSLEGIEAQVQHTMATGKPYTDAPGSCGVGVVTLPTGQPRVIFQVKHADGSSLAVIMKAGDAETVRECLVDAMALAQAIADAAATEVRQ